MKESNNLKDKKNWYLASICLAVIMLGILFYFFTANFTHIIEFIRKVNSVLAPIYAGSIIAFLLLPVHEFFLVLFQEKLSIQDSDKKWKISNALAIFTSLALAFLLLYLLLAMVLPQLYLTIENIVKSIPDISSITTPNWLDNYFESHPEVYATIAPYYEDIIKAIDTWIQTDILPYFNSVDNFLAFGQSILLPNITGVVTGFSQFIAGFFSFVANVLVAIIVSIYLLARKKLFAAEAKKLTFAMFSDKWANLILFEVRNAYKIMSGFISGKLLDSFIIGIICFIGATLLKLPYTSLVATVIGVTNIIPFFGPFIGAVPCGILIFFVSPIKCLYFIIFIVVLQQFDGNILGPKILGDSTGLGSFWVLFAIILFGGIFGILGMFLGVPIFATFYSMASRLCKYSLKTKNLPVETEFYSDPKNNI